MSNIFDKQYEVIDEIEELISNNILDNRFSVQDNDIDVATLPAIIVDCIKGDNDDLSSGETFVVSPVIEVIMLIPVGLYDDVFKDARMALGINWSILLAKITAESDKESLFDYGKYAGGKNCVRAKTKLYL